MVVLEPWTPVGSLKKCLERAGEVNEAVAHEEEHRQKRSKDVDIAQQDTALANHHRQKQGPEN